MNRRWNIAQLWKLFSYISGRILKISFWNCDSSLLRMHFAPFCFYRSSRFSQKNRAFNSCFNSAQKSISTSKFQVYFVNSTTHKQNFKRLFCTLLLQRVLCIELWKLWTTKNSQLFHFKIWCGFLTVYFVREEQFLIKLI